MRARMGITVLVAAALATGALYAGAVYEVVCGTRGCGFKAQVAIGGGKAEAQVTGFCSRCAKPVEISWKRGGAAPAPAAQAWDPLSGKTRSLYPCPKCRTPFVALDSAEEFRHCPRCKKPSLSARPGLFFD